MTASFYIFNPETGRYLRRDQGIVRWVDLKSEASALPERLANELLQSPQFEACLSEYAGHMESWKER